MTSLAGYLQLYFCLTLFVKLLAYRRATVQGDIGHENANE